MLKIAASASIKAIIDEFSQNILYGHYAPKTAVNSLKALFAAVALLQLSDAELVNKAEQFIKDTSTATPEELLRLKNLASTIKQWDSFEICSIYTDNLGHSSPCRRSKQTLS